MFDVPNVEKVKFCKKRLNTAKGVDYLFNVLYIVWQEVRHDNKSN